MQALVDAMNGWDIDSYPDEAGFRARMAGVIEAWAAEPYERRSQAVSVCPDSGLRVLTWALEDEEIVSPYSGRRYRQGPTGYFGPKERDADGRITRFGGDPLKYALIPATARLLSDPDDAAARAFATIPGNLNQQYHFAAVNWGRFLGLVGPRMDSAWHTAFRAAVAGYRESRHPSDGLRELVNPPDVPFDLVGEEDFLLGGNPCNGGTENHKIMWRTTGLLYAQLLGADARISGYGAAEAAARTSRALRDYLQRLLVTGNGEYDSVTYYLYVILGYLNLFDFSPDSETRQLARLTLDYYFATYGLKSFGGVLAGASKRGFSDGFRQAGTDVLVNAFCPGGPLATAGRVRPPLHQATTRYRPNRVLCNIIAKNVALPFESHMARPSYHMNRPNRFQETFYCDRDFALGSVALTESDNPAQQTVWSLAARGVAGPIVIGGGQPRFRSPQGHSPYDQVFQCRNCLVLITAHTAANGSLERLPREMAVADRWELAPRAAETWLFVPRRSTTWRVREDLVLIDAGSAHVAVRPLGGAPFPLAASVGGKVPEVLSKYDVIVFPGLPTGFVVEVQPVRDSTSLEEFEAEVRGRTHFDRGDFAQSGRIVYRMMDGTELEVTHDSGAFRCRAAVGGRRVDWEGWCRGGVYESPYLKVGQGRMVVTDGREGYEMRADENGLEYRAVE